MIKSYQRINMKIKIIIKITILALFVMCFANISNAYTMSSTDIKAKKGEEFTVVLNVDEDTPLANGRIKFDTSKIEYVGVTQENMTAAESESGKVSWMYIDLYGSGVKSFEFKFKVKEKGATTLNLEDLVFINSEGTRYTAETISGNTSINVNKGNNTMIFIIIIAILLIVGILFIKSRKK